MLTEPETFRGLPADFRAALDGWMFERYVEGIGDDLAVAPTPDETLTLDEMIADIEAATEPWYARICDCRVLSGTAEPAAKAHCLSHTPEEGARPLSTEEAVAIARQADKEGFIHTRSPYGFCNCQADYCYLFRVRARRMEQAAQSGETATALRALSDSPGLGQLREDSHPGESLDSSKAPPVQDPSGWLVGRTVIEFDPGRCTACGRCLKRCQFGVFERDGKRKVHNLQRSIVARPERCIGCGVCVATCPAAALHLEKRRDRA